MPLEPVVRRSLPDEVADQLFEQIVSGQLEAGESLPSERRLAEVLGVSRPAVREGLKRLAGSGLVSIRQGDTTRVNDFRTAGGLDLLPRLLLRADGIDPHVARDVFDVRAAMGPIVVATAAERRTDDDVRRLRRRLDMLADCDPHEDPEARQQAALDLWDAVVDATHNVAHRLLFNALRTTYEPVLDLLTMVLHDEVADTDGHRDVVDAIADGDADRARADATTLLAVGTTAAMAALDALADHTSTLKGS